MPKKEDALVEIEAMLSIQKMPMVTQYHWVVINLSVVQNLKSEIWNLDVEVHILIHNFWTSDGFWIRSIGSSGWC